MFINMFWGIYIYIFIYIEKKKKKTKVASWKDSPPTYFLRSLVEREKELVRAKEVVHTTTMEHRS
jgi:hypothetical protein